MRAELNSLFGNNSGIGRAMSMTEDTLHGWLLDDNESWVRFDEHVQRFFAGGRYHLWMVWECSDQFTEYV